MKKIIGLTKRNLLIFFKDRQTIIYSLLTSIIVFVLYLLFLKGSFIDGMNSILKEIPILKEKINTTDIDTLANLILLSGILGSAMITAPFNCLTTIVRDRENKIDYDILATPVKRWQIIVSYFIASVISAFILTGIILTIGLIALYVKTDIHISMKNIILSYGIVALGSISSTAIFILLMLFFKSSQASGAFFGLLSAASGFIIGAYVPISQFSNEVQTVCNLFPASQITILLKNTLLNGTLETMNQSLGGIDNGEFINTIKELFTFKAKLFGNTFDIQETIVYIIVWIFICIVLQIFLYSKKYKKK